MPKVIYKKSKQHIIYSVLYSIIPVLLLAVTLIISNNSFVSSVYADGLDYNVQIRPSLNVTLSSSTVSLVLNPSTSPFGKANLDVSVGTNNPTGYKLYINTTNGNDKLTNNTTLTTPVYIDTLSSSTTETTFPANSWGYRISSLSSGNEGGDSSITDTTGTNFFPYVSGAMISSASSAVTSSTSTLTFGAKVDYDKPAGIYSLDFSFKAVPSISTYNIQNLPESECTSDSTVVTDSRDGQAYTVARLGDGNCWMTQNLRFTGTTLTPADSDVKTNKTIAYEDLTEGDSYDDLRIHKGVDDKGNSTVWYNYAAASAGTITGDSNTVEASESVCPAGWRLPTDDEITGIISYVDAFSPVAGGRYNGGSISDIDWGNWWSSKASTATNRYILDYDGSSTMYIHNFTRSIGRYIRCIRKKSIQDYTKSLCQTQAASSNVTLTDERDGNNYTARYINGNCWMTENLRFGADTSNPDNYQITLDPATSNVESAKTLTAYDLVAHGTEDSDKLCNGTYNPSEQTGSGEGYTTPCVHTSGDGSSVWYNYSAATAGTITGANNITDATQDICPAGWQLPTDVEAQTIGDYSTTYVSVFNPSYGGGYDNGALYDATVSGFWWSSTTYSDLLRYRLGYDSVDLYTNDNKRFRGAYVRCVAKE